MLIINTTPEGSGRSSACWKSLLALMALIVTAQFASLNAQEIQDISERRGGPLFGMQSKPASDLDGWRLGLAPLFPGQLEAAPRPVAFSPAVENPKLQLKRESAPRTPLLLGLYMAQIVLQSLDARSTLLAVREGKGREGNPVLSPFASSPPLLVGFKMGATIGVIGTFDRLHRTHPRAATITMIAADLGYGFVVAHNQSVLNSRHSVR